MHKRDKKTAKKAPFFGHPFSIEIRTLSPIISLKHAEFLALPKIKCIDLGQPEMNNVDAIYKRAQQYKVPLIRVQVDEGELTLGSVINRFPTGVTLVHNADSLEKAQYIMKAYEKAAESCGDVSL